MYILYNSKADADAEFAKRQLGYPKAPVHIGSRIAHLVPSEYSPGAIGWEAQEGDLMLTKDGKYALSVLSDPESKSVELPKTEFDGATYEVLKVDLKADDPKAPK